MLVPHNGTITPPQTSKTCMFVKRCKNCGLARHDGCDVCEGRDKVAVIHWVCVVLYGGVFYSVLSLLFHPGLLCYCIGIWNLLRDVMQ